MIPDPEPKQSFELATQRLLSGASLCVAVDRMQDIQSGILFDGPDFLPNVGLEARLLHVV